MTQAETIFYIQVGIEKLNEEIDFQVLLHKDLAISIMNSPYGPYLKKGEKYPYKLENFKNKKSLKNEEISEAEKSKRWLAAGNACMEVVEQHKNDLRSIKRGVNR